MKRQYPGNANGQRCDPRFSGARGRGRGPMNPTPAFGPGRGGPFRGGGFPPMNGGRGGGPVNNFPPGGRGPPGKFFGRGMGQQQQPYHRSQMHPPPPSQQHLSHGNHGQPGPPPHRGGPPSGMMGRGRINMGQNSFIGGRGRGRNNMPGRNPFAGRGGMQQQRGPPPPFRGGGPPPPPPRPRLPHPSTMNGNSQPYQQQMQAQSPSYGNPSGLSGINQRQPQTYQQQPSQQPGPPAAPPYQQVQTHHPQQSLSPNNNSFTGYQQVTNPAHVPQNQLPLQAAGTVSYQNILTQPTTSIVTPSSNTANSSTGNPSAQHINEGWKEYTAPNGVKYYYNDVSKESTYVKPEALKMLEQTNRTSSTESSTASSSTKRTWHEHEDATTGKKYYSDGVSTTWEKPKGFVSPETIVANTSSGSKREEHNLHDAPATKKRKQSSNAVASSNTSSDYNSFAFSNKKEAIAAFKGVLLEKGISPTFKWNEVLKVCEADSRWDSFENILSMGERRQALAEYQTKRTNELRNEQRQERIRANKAFGELLADILPSVPGFSARTSRFTDIKDALAKDDRFFAIEDDSTRESLFFDFCDDFKKRDERNKRNKRREIQKSFVSFLQEKEGKGTLSYNSTWESFLPTLFEEEKLDSRFVTSHELTDSDRRLYFADFIAELKKAEDEKRRRIQDERRRAEKAQRDKYRELLRELAVQGKILPYSRWREIEEFIAQDDSFQQVEEQDRSAPRELFEIFVDNWDSIYRLERSFLLQLLRPPGKPDIVISAGIGFDLFKKILIEEAAYSSEIQDETSRIINRKDYVSSAQVLYNELTAQKSRDLRQGSSRRGSTNDDSSEDEGEIIEEGEITDNNEQSGDNDNKPE